MPGCPDARIVCTHVMEFVLEARGDILVVGWTTVTHDVRKGVG